MKWFQVLLGVIIISACEDNSLPKNSSNTGVTNSKHVNDSSIVKDFSFEKGDLRRYGIRPNADINIKTLNDVINLGRQGLELKFSEGYYNLNLVLKGQQNLAFYFDNTIITGSVQIIDDNEKISSNILLKGQLTVLDKVFIRKSQKIEFENLIILSDTLKSLSKKLNRGLSIYAGSKDIKINNLTIYNTGGLNDEFYKFTAAALQVHGWNNNPENVVIRNLLIKNAQRTAVYLTGNNQIIRKATITGYAQNGGNINMFGLDDAKPGTEKEFAGFWINKCNDCIIDSLLIENTSEKPYSLKFGVGTYSKPAVINNLSLKGMAKKAPIKDDILTNVLVKNEY